MRSNQVSIGTGIGNSDEQEKNGKLVFVENLLRLGEAAQVDDPAVIGSWESPYLC